MATAAICSGLRFGTPGFSANLLPGAALLAEGRGAGDRAGCRGTAPSQLDLQSWSSGDHQGGRILQLVKVTPEHFFQDSVRHSLCVC